MVEREGQVQAEAIRSANAPSISIQQQPQSYTEETNLSWQGEDLDGGFLVNSGLKAVITRRAVVTDEWDRRREKRGCSAVLQGLSSALFGLLLLVGGLALMTLAFFQEVLPWLGF